jgi:hypothetical protein
MQLRRRTRTRKIHKIKKTQKRGGNPNKIALLFLTKDKIFHKNIWKQKGYENTNIYIHPKYPKQNGEWNRWEINRPVPTKWGDCSIVEATLLLLNQSLQCTKNQWFVLCSDDSYPLKTFHELQHYLQTQTLSHIQCLNPQEKKSSQWFTLTRKDAETLLMNPNLDRVLTNLKKTKKACDEYFLLNTLPHLNYVNRNMHYIKWITEINPSLVAKHPTIFQHILSTKDPLENYFFIRKTTTQFTPIPIQPTGETILIIHGTSSPNRHSKEWFGNGNYSSNLPLFFLNLTSSLPPNLPENTIQIFSVVWNQVEPAKQSLVTYLKNTGFTTVHVIEENTPLP